jgi:ABC-2 type transport system permease protein
MTNLSTTLAAHPFTERQTLISHWRALMAVARREWLIFIRYPSWVFALFVWPVIFPLFFLLTGLALAGPDGSGMEQFTQISGSSDFIGFVVIGTTIWMWQNVVLWDVGFALRKEQWRGTLESNWMTPTWRFAYLLGSSFPQLASMLMFLTITGLEFGLFFGVRLNGNPWLLALMLLACIPAIYGMGFAFASLVIWVKEANTFVFLVRGLVMIFCGVTYPVVLLPEWMRWFANVLPQTYMIHGMRSAALANASLVDLLPDLTMLMGFGAFWLITGSLLFNWLEKHTRKTGAIGQY